MIYLLIVHVIASIPNITVTLGPFQGSTDNSTAISIYQNGTMNSDFDITKYPQLSCTPIELEKFKVTNFKYNSTANQTFTLPLVIQNNALPIVITSVKIQDYHSYSEIPIVSTQYPIYISTQGTILLSHVCSNVSTNTNYWAVKDVTITFQNYSALNFQYQFICDPDYHPARFDWSSIIHLVYVSLIIWLLARKGKIYSFKIVFKGTQPSLDYSKQPPFQGFTLYWPQALFYIALLVVFGQNDDVQDDEMDRKLNIRFKDDEQTEEQKTQAYIATKTPPKSQMQILFSTAKQKLGNLLSKKKGSTAPSKKGSYFILQTDGIYKLMWDTMCMLLIIYEIIAIPLKLAFDIILDSSIENLVTILFICDILVSFNTSYYHKGQSITDRKKIALNYLSLWFWIDLVASFPYENLVEWISQVNPDTDTSSAKSTATLLGVIRFTRFIKIIRLVRLAKLKVFLERFEEAIQFSVWKSTIFSFVKLCAFVLFWSHWLGCVFHYIAVQESFDGDWLHYGHLEDEIWQVRYINSLYWGVTTMNTVGYGDISPRSTLERGFGVLFLMVATVVFSVNMNSIGTSLQGMEDRKQSLSKKLSNITKYLKKQSIPTYLQNRIKQYLKFVWEQEQQLNISSMSEDLSHQLRFQLEIHVNGNIIRLCQPLHSNFSSQFLLEATKTFKQYLGYPGEFIISELDTEYKEKHLYFIQNGSVNLVFQKNRQIITKLEKNEYFGEIGFFTGQTRTASIQSINFTGLVYIDRPEFLKVLSNFQNDLQIFHQIKEDIIYNNNYSKLKLYCYGCFRDDHVLANCSNLHFVVEQPLYFQMKDKFSTKLQNLFNRKDRVHFNARSNYNYIRVVAHQISAVARRVMAQYEECNLNDSVIDIIQEEKKVINSPKPPKFGPFRSRFREDRAKYRKMKSHIHEQEQKIKSLVFQQNMSEAIIKQLASLYRQVNPGMKSSQQMATLQSFRQNTMKRKGSGLSGISKKQDLDSSYNTVPPDAEENEYENNWAQSSRQLDEITMDNVKNQEELFEFLHSIYQKKYEEELKIQESINKQENLILDRFDKGVDFVSFNPKYNLEVVIEEYNRYNQGIEFRPKPELYFDNDYLNEAMQLYQYDLKTKTMTEKQFQTLLELQRNVRGKKQTRSVKLKNGTMTIASPIKKPSIILKL